jgi:hypothetical protein
MGSFDVTCEGETLALVSVIVGTGGMDSSISGKALIRDSTDCDDTTRTFGGALRSIGGIGEFGWLRYGEALVTKKEKLARVTSRWAR